jgi:hypothetical protein
MISLEQSTIEGQSPTAALTLPNRIELSKLTQCPARAVLAVWTDISPESEGAFNEWYYREHIPERLAVPGFLRGRRFMALEGGPKYFACYDLADAGVPVSDAYLQRLNNPTETTCRIMPRFRNMTRAICSVNSYHGRGTGASLLTIQVRPKPDIKPELRALIAQDLLPSLSAQAGIVSMQLWLADNTPTPVTRERELRGVDDGTIDWAVVIEAISPDSAGTAAERLLRITSPLNYMTAEPPVRAIYQLLYSLDSRE